MPPAFHDSIVYVDESGDHGPVSPEYPIFVLAFCIFEKKRYVDEVSCEMQRLKLEYFGHDAVVLHERDIRKASGPFKILQDPTVRARFMEDLNDLVEGASFTLIASAIRKDRLSVAYTWPENPYHLAMTFGLERIAMHFHLQESSPLMHLVCECRGRTEDEELELAFRRSCDLDGNSLQKRLPLELVLAPKQGNYCGMQLADLIARPIGRHLLQPLQPNRAWDILENKFRTNPSGGYAGWGLKIFP
jgi:hypothetical protein